MTLARGKVEFFDRKKQFGRIAPEGGEESVFVHVSAIRDQQFRYLVDGEAVQFELGQNEKGPVALQVERLEPRFSGTVETFSPKKGFGTIVSDDGDVELFVHFSQIVSRRQFRELSEGERVEFAIGKGRGSKHEALMVTTDARLPLERFAVLPDYDSKLEQLAQLAQSEDWNYKHTKSAKPFPVLFSYLHYTFKRLEEEKKIAFAEQPSRGQRLACFNTGLVTKYYEPILAAFRENRHPQPDSPWVLIGFFTESQEPMTAFPQLPDTANYFEDPAELLYDRRLKLVKNIAHIIDQRSERLPQRYQEDPRNLPAVLNMAVEQAEKRVARNYKTAIPQFNRGKIQLLLPLCLEDPTRADLALVVGKEGAVYKGYTVLTLDMAYNNARLLTRPDDEWLIP